MTSLISAKIDAKIDARIDAKTDSKINAKLGCRVSTWNTGSTPIVSARQSKYYYPVGAGKFSQFTKRQLVNMINDRRKNMRRLRNTERASKTLTKKGKGVKACKTEPTVGERSCVTSQAARTKQISYQVCSRIQTSEYE